jgi:hypothetical protein
VPSRAPPVAPPLDAAAAEGARLGSADAAGAFEAAAVDAGLALAPTSPTGAGVVCRNRYENPSQAAARSTAPRRMTTIGQRRRRGSARSVGGTAAGRGAVTSGLLVVVSGS